MEEESRSYDASEIIAAEVLTSLLPERATWLELGGSKRTNTNASCSCSCSCSSSSSKCFGLPLFRWGCRRRRSAIAVPVSWPRHQPKPNPSWAESHPQPPPKAEASSPATPLSFSPSESDDKDKRNPTLHLPSYISLKRKREHYLKIIQDIKKDNDLLAGEIKNVKCYYERVKDFNLKLKARKQELSNGPNRRALHSSPQIRGIEPVGDARFQNHDEASCGQPMTSFGVVSPSERSGSALGIGNRNSNDVGPFGIPDLNLPLEAEEKEEEFMGEGVECCEALDNKNNVSRALAAQARQKRIQICRLKNPRASCR